MDTIQTSPTMRWTTEPPNFGVPACVIQPEVPNLTLRRVASIGALGVLSPEANLAGAAIGLTFPLAILGGFLVCGYFIGKRAGASPGWTAAGSMLGTPGMLAAIALTQKGSTRKNRSRKVRRNATGVYKQTFQNGDEIYFVATHQQKNGASAGSMVRVTNGRVQKPKRTSVSNFGLWTRVTTADVPTKVLEKFGVMVQRNASKGEKIIASSFERYNGGVRIKRQWGSSTVTRFYVRWESDKNNAAKWDIIEGFGKTPGERKTYAMEVFRALRISARTPSSQGSRASGVRKNNRRGGLR